MSERQTVTPKRPLLRYHGGKWKLAPWIISHFPSHRVYTEAYGGGASVLLRKPRSYSEVYNDLDGEIVNLFRVVREHGDTLRELIRLTPFSRSDFSESYQPSPNPIEQGRRTLARSFMGFGSNSLNRATGFRSCSNRSGTTPAHDWTNFPTHMDNVIERLRGVVIENRDAPEILLAHDAEEALHYVDPPYPKITRDKGSDYRHEMTDDDHRALAAVLRSLKGNVVLSGYPCALYDVELFSGWHRVENRGAHADGARKRTEVLWMNFTPDGQRNLL